MATGSVKVIYGMNDMEAERLVGKTVGTAKDSLSMAFNIPDNAVPMVNGNEAESCDVLKAGDELEFIKPAGSKG